MWTTLATLPALLPLVLTWLGGYSLCRELAACERLPSSRRLSLLLANVLCGAILTLVVEATSWLHWLRASTVAVGLLLAAGVFWGGAWVLARRRQQPLLHGLALDLSEGWRHCSLGTKVLAIAAGAIVVVLGLVALLTPTTNYDSLTYHLPRVLHWIQNQSVAHYPTSDARQLESGPWAAFAMATLHLLAGGDWHLNLLQWWAMVSCALGMSWLAEELWTKGRPADPPVMPADTASKARVGVLAFFLVVTLPTGIVQSITTQNDYGVTAWLVTLVAVLWKLLEAPRNLYLVGAAALAVALGLLTKVTFLIFVFPFLACGGVLWLWRLRSMEGSIRAAVLLALAVGLLDGPHFLRNAEVFGSPLGSRYMFLLQRNEPITLSGTASVILRNASLHTATGWEPLTQLLNRALGAAHRFTGRGLNDASTTFCAGAFSFQKGFKVNDNLTGDFHHALLLGLAGLTLMLKRVPGRGWMLAIAALVGVSSVTFCAYVRWQAWHSRFHLPYFVLLLPGVALVMGALWRRWLNLLVSVGLTALAVVCVGWNESRPLFTGGDFIFQPREQQYFLQAADLYFPSVRMAEDVVASRAQEVGIRVRHDYPALLDEMEYPQWVLLRNRGFAGRWFHVFVTNESAALPPWPSNLGAVITSPSHASTWLAARVPCRVIHGPYAIHFSDHSSRWAQLTRYGREGREALATSPLTLRFEDGRIDFVFAAGRQGILQLRGAFTGGAGGLTAGHRLFIHSDAGCARLEPLQGRDLALAVPLPEGSTPLYLQVVPPDGSVGEGWGLERFQWEWQAAGVGQPLPWAYVTKIKTGEGLRKEEDPSHFRLSSKPTSLDVTAGAPGQIELLLDVSFDVQAGTRSIRVISSGGDTRDIDLRPGQNLIPVPVVAGANALALSWPQAPATGSSPYIEVQSLELRFRQP